MRRIADLYPGEAKTDAAFVIADEARSMPHTLRSIELADEMIVGFDDDLAGEATRISNRLRGLLTQIHPHLERVLGPRIHHPAVLKLLDRFGSPTRIRPVGRETGVASGPGHDRRRWVGRVLLNGGPVFPEERDEALEPGKAVVAT